MKRSLWALLAAFSLALATLAQSPSIPSVPLTPKRPVTDEYHGVKVVDDYRWLENWDAPQTKQWSAAENARSRAYLDGLAVRSAVKERLRQLISAGSASYYNLQNRGGVLFAVKYQPPQQQPVLVSLPSPDDPQNAKVVFDPNAASSKGLLAIDFYVPSLDGKYVAAACSENGSEDSTAHVFEVATGKELGDLVPRVNFATAGGSIEWKADGSGFYYTRYPQANERPPEDANFYQQVYFHKLGADPKQDSYVIGKEFPRIAEIQLRSSDNGRYLLASVANGDGGQFAHYVMDSSGRWTQVTHFGDGVVSAKFGSKEDLYLLSRKDAPRGQILRLASPDAGLLQAKVIVAQNSGASTGEETRTSIENFVLSGSNLYVTDIIGGPSRMRVFDGQGNLLTTVQPPISAIGQVVAWGGSDVILSVSSYLHPDAWWHFDSEQKKLVSTALIQTSASKFDDAEVIREFAISRDGTRVP